MLLLDHQEDDVVLLKPAVRRVGSSELTAMCAELTRQVRGFDPDVVVGIATGGSDIAEAIADELGGRRLVVVRSQRPGTLLKQGRHAARVLAALPERLANLARWVEVEYREARYYLDERTRGPEPAPTDRIRDPEDLADAVALAGRVLVVDDTLDSGQTIRGVVETVRAANPTAEVRTAVIATTWRRPPMTPDYVLQPRLLLRLPSSFDA